MLFPELESTVYTFTNRPDLIQETRRALQGATTWAHSLDFFFKDMAMSYLTFTTKSYEQSMDVTQLARYRAVGFLRRNPRENSPAFDSPYPVTPSDFANLWWRHDPEPLKEISATDIINRDSPALNYGLYRRGVYFQMGFTLYMRFDLPVKHALFAYYTYPNVDISNDGMNFRSWIAVEIPYLLIYYATAQIFNMIGQENDAAIYMKPPAEPGGEYGGMIADHIRLVKVNNILATGR